MRHSDMINSIVEAEHHAREITDNAEEKRRHLDEEVAQVVCQMEKEYEEKAKLRIEQAKREEEALRQRSLAELEGRLQSAMDDLEKKSQIQHDAWVDALFSHIVGEEDVYKRQLESFADSPEWPPAKSAQ